jgi:DNA-binding CsgD family transcriptional regulator
MVKGLNTPQIAAALNISYNTVENHKRNIRAKTNTKTSAELIHFVMNNNML